MYYLKFITWTVLILFFYIVYMLVAAYLIEL